MTRTRPGGDPSCRRCFRSIAIVMVPSRATRWLVRLSCAGVLASGGTVAASDWGHRRSGQTLALISQLAVGPYGIVVSSGLVMLGLAAIGLGVALLQARSRSFFHTFTAWGLAGTGMATLLLCAVPLDPSLPIGGSGRNLLHGNLFALQIVTAIVAAICWPLAVRRAGRTAAVRGVALCAGLVVVAAAMAVVGMRGERAAMIQRVWLVSNIAWLLACGNAQLRHSRGLPS